MLNFIINPVAGKGKTLKIVGKIEEYCKAKNIAYTLFFTKSTGNATDLAKDICLNKLGDIAVVGGDGTINEVLNGMSNFEDVNLGIVPYGTGNDFAKSIGIQAKNIAAAIDIINEAEPKYTDFIELNENVRVMNITGMGIDVDVLQRYKKAKIIKGKLAYYKALLISLFKFKWNKFKVKFDGGEFTEKTALITAVCNGKYLGGGIKVSPKSDASDGLLNVIIVNKISRIKIIFALVALMRGKILKKKYVDHILCKKIELITTAKPIINIDGELIESAEFKCNVVHNKLKVFRR